MSMVSNNQQVDPEIPEGELVRGPMTEMAGGFCCRYALVLLHVVKIVYSKTTNLTGKLT